MTSREVTKEEFDSFVAARPWLVGGLNTMNEPPVMIYSTPNTWDGPFERQGHLVAFMRYQDDAPGTNKRRYFLVEETDEQLRERSYPTRRQPDLLQVVIGCALACERPPSSLRGETVSPGHVRVYARADSETLAGLERRCRYHLTPAWQVDVLLEIA